MQGLIVRIDKRFLLSVAAITAVLLLIYAPSLGNEFVLWDDDYLIVNNPLIRSLSPRSIWTAFTSYDPELYIPLTFLSYQINYLIAGLHPFAYHLTNLLLHAANAVLITAVAYKLSRKNMWIAAAAGLLFAVHPLHTEAVVWASARKDVLASTFFLSSLLLYLQYRTSNRQQTYIWSVAMFLCALLSKVSVITLPLILLLVDWREARRWNAKMLIEKIPYAALSVVFGAIALFGKTQQIAHGSIAETALLMIRSTTFYMEKLVLPLHLSPMYPHVGAVSLASPAFSISAIVILILVVVSVWSLRWTREAMCALLFFLLAIAPSMINFRKGEEGDIYIASDRYAYIASFAVIFLIVMMLWKFRQRLSAAVMNTAVAIVLIMFSTLSSLQAEIWTNSETLFKAVIASYPQAQAAHHNLGVEYQKQGHLQMALDEYQEALSIAPKASTESNIGDIFRESGMLPEAGAHYQQALTINPRSVDAMLGIGLIFLQQKDAGKAIIAFTSAVEFAPDDSRAHLSLGAALMTAKRIDQAIAEYQKATALDPSNAAAFFNLGVALERAGDTAGAQSAFGSALQLDPSLEQK